MGEHHRKSGSTGDRSERTGVRRSARSRRYVWFAGLLGGMLALAVWGKLRFVSDVPRMAYAEPDSGEQVETAESYGARRTNR
ncbi:MAG: hypothetical protein AAGJ54_03420 [Planctomycetota bacterium]